MRLWLLAFVLSAAVPAAPDPLSLPDAIRSRMLKMLAEKQGAGPLTAYHVSALDALVTSFRGQGAVSLPGGFEAKREYGRLVIAPNPTLDDH